MRIVRNLFILLVVLVALAALALTFGWQPRPFAPGSVSAARLQPGPLEVMQYDTVFEDPGRPTAANGDFPGSDSRRLEASVWYPQDREAAPYPLLVYSHGFSSSREGGAYLAEHMASLGYVVVAVDFPLTNMGAPGGPEVRDVVNQPGDVRFVIDSVLGHSKDSAHRLAALVDAERIGVFGLSLGGLTTELVAFHPQMRDPRIAAALSIAGPSDMLMPRFFQHAPELPFLMLAADIDALVPYPDNAAPIPGKMPGAELVTLRGGSHTGFAGPAAAMRWLDNPDVIGCFIVERNINEALEEEEDWFHLIGSPAQGIKAVTENGLCRMDPLPEAMNVLRQHMISRVVVSSFFEREFSRSEATRDSAALYLRQQMATELAPEVRYEVSARSLPDEPRTAAAAD